MYVEETARWPKS